MVPKTDATSLQSYLSPSRIRIVRVRLRAGAGSAPIDLAGIAHGRSFCKGSRLTNL